LRRERVALRREYELDGARSGFGQANMKDKFTGHKRILLDSRQL
jgi:hypothetical protein